jgi:hypothetical protein
MKINKLWEKLFTAKTPEVEMALHSAGATIRHKNPFEHLDVPRNDDKLTKEFADKWISPYYMTLMFDPGEEKIKTFVNGADQFTIDNTKKLLGYFDWRPKITAAYFAAINNHIELEDIIGNLLLKSEVCDAGRAYCFALAIFGSERSKDYLKKYLEYYLSRKELWFDQAYAFCALEYLDENESKLFLDDWNEFVSNKPNWGLKNSREILLASIENLLNIRSLINK